MYSLYYLTSELDNMQPRYIGYTSKTINKRLKYHLEDWKHKKCKSHKVNWINYVIKNGADVLICLIEEVKTIEEAVFLEKQLIANNINTLTNSTMGGEISKVLLEDVKKRISDSLKKYFKTNGAHPSYNKGKKTSEATKQLLREKISKYKQFSFEELYYLYVTKRLSVAEIIKVENTSRKSLEIQIKRYNLINERKKLYSQSYFKTKKIKTTIEFSIEDVINYYVKEKVSIENIAKRYAITVSAVRRILKNNKVEIKKNNEKSKIKLIRQFSRENIPIATYKSYKELAEHLNKKITAVYASLNYSKTCWGYKWEIEYF